MSRTQDIVSDIKSKLTALKRSKDALKNDNERLRLHMDKVKRELMESRDVAERLEAEMKTLRMAQTIGGNAEETRETKLKINEMVKEIDRCIAMLNK